MNKRERVYAALEGEPVDRVPLSLWRHFHKQDQTPAGLAAATLAFYQQHNFDLIKLTPSGFYGIEDWGAQVILSKSDDQPPRLKKPVIHKPEEWRDLQTLRVTEGSYGRALEAVRLVAQYPEKDKPPLLMTIYSPLTLAYKLAGDLLLEHLKHHATDVQIGLATIAETTARFAEAVLEAGADGIFFTSQLSRGDMLSAEACQRFVVRYDLIALERVKALPAPLVLHLHGKHIYFDTVNQYPAHAVSWHNHETPPSLLEALALTDKTIFTGLDRDTFAQGTPQELVAQVTEAIEESGGRRLILAPACVIPPAATPEHLRAVAEVNRSIGANQYEQT